MNGSSRHPGLLQELITVYSACRRLSHNPNLQACALCMRAIYFFLLNIGCVLGACCFCVLFNNPSQPSCMVIYAWECLRTTVALTHGPPFAHRELRPSGPYIAQPLPIHWLPHAVTGEHFWPILGQNQGENQAIHSITASRRHMHTNTKKQTLCLSASNPAAQLACTGD